MSPLASAPSLMRMPINYQTSKDGKSKVSQGKYKERKKDMSDDADIGHSVPVNAAINYAICLSIPFVYWRE